MIKKIISGAQTGADRAGLAAAAVLSLEVGGTVPRGRRAEDGPLTDRTMKLFNLKEHSSDKYPPRTKANVWNSDGTVVFGNVGSPGSRLTLKYCRELGKPYCINPTPDQLRVWALKWKIETLNVAGNRENSNPGIYRSTLNTLIEAFKT